MFCLQRVGVVLFSGCFYGLISCLTRKCRERRKMTNPLSWRATLTLFLFRSYFLSLSVALDGLTDGWMSLITLKRAGLSLYKAFLPVVVEASVCFQISLIPSKSTSLLPSLERYLFSRSLFHSLTLPPFLFLPHSLSHPVSHSWGRPVAGGLLCQ